MRWESKNSGKRLIAIDFEVRLRSYKIILISLTISNCGLQVFRILPFLAALSTAASISYNQLHSLDNPNSDMASTQNTHKRTIMILIILAGFILVVFFGLRTFRTIMRIRHMEMRPLSTDVELIRGWMTVPFISDTYRVPVEVLVEACDLPPAPKRHENLNQINRKISPNEPGALVECLKDAITKFQQSHPTPPAKQN